MASTSGLVNSFSTIANLAKMAATQSPGNSSSNTKVITTKSNLPPTLQTPVVSSTSANVSKIVSVPVVAKSVTTSKPLIIPSQNTLEISTGIDRIISFPPIFLHSAPAWFYSACYLAYNNSRNSNFDTVNVVFGSEIDPFDPQNTNLGNTQLFCLFIQDGTYRLYIAQDRFSAAYNPLIKEISGKFTSGNSPIDTIYRTIAASSIFNCIKFCFVGTYMPTGIIPSDRYLRQLVKPGYYPDSGIKAVVEGMGISQIVPLTYIPGTGSNPGTYKYNQNAPVYNDDPTITPIVNVVMYPLIRASDNADFKQWTVYENTANNTASFMAPIYYSIDSKTTRRFVFEQKDSDKKQSELLFGSTAYFATRVQPVTTSSRQFLNDNPNNVQAQNLLARAFTQANIITVSTAKQSLDDVFSTQNVNKFVQGLSASTNTYSRGISGGGGQVSYNTAYPIFSFDVPKGTVTGFGFSSPLAESNFAISNIYDPSAVPPQSTTGLQTQSDVINPIIGGIAEPTTHFLNPYNDNLPDLVKTLVTDTSAQYRSFYSLTSKLIDPSYYDNNQNSGNTYTSLAEYLTPTTAKMQFDNADANGKLIDYIEVPVTVSLQQINTTLTPVSTSGANSIATYNSITDNDITVLTNGTGIALTVGSSATLNVGITPDVDSVQIANVVATWKPWSHGTYSSTETPVFNPNDTYSGCVVVDTATGKYSDVMSGADIVDDTSNLTLVIVLNQAKSFPGTAKDASTSLVGGTITIPYSSISDNIEIGNEYYVTLTVAGQQTNQILIKDSSLYIFGNINNGTNNIGKPDDNTIYVSASAINSISTLGLTDASYKNGNKDMYGSGTLIVGTFENVNLDLSKIPSIGTSSPSSPQFVYIPASDWIYIKQSGTAGLWVMTSIIDIGSFATDPSTLPYPPGFWPTKSRYLQLKNKCNPYLNIDGSDVITKTDTGFTPLPNYNTPMFTYLDQARFRQKGAIYAFDTTEASTSYTFEISTTQTTVPNIATAILDRTVMVPDELVQQSSSIPIISQQSSVNDVATIADVANMSSVQTTTGSSTVISQSTQPTEKSINTLSTDINIAALNTNLATAQNIDKFVATTQSIASVSNAQEALAKISLPTYLPAPQSNVVSNNSQNSIAKFRINPLHGVMYTNETETYIVSVVMDNLTIPNVLPQPTEDEDYDPNYVRFVDLKNLSYTCRRSIAPSIVYNASYFFSEQGLTYTNYLSEKDDLSMGYIADIANGLLKQCKFDYISEEVLGTNLFTNVPYNNNYIPYYIFNPRQVLAINNFVTSGSSGSSTVSTTNTKAEFVEAFSTQNQLAFSTIQYTIAQTKPVYFFVRDVNYRHECKIMQASIDSTHPSLYQCYGNGDLIPCKLFNNNKPVKTTPSHMYKLTYTISDNKYVDSKIIKISNVPYVVGLFDDGTGINKFTSFSLQQTPGSTDVTVGTSQQLTFPSELYIVGNASTTLESVSSLGSINVTLNTTGDLVTGGTDASGNPIYTAYKVIAYNNLVYLIRAVQGVSGLGVTQDQSNPSFNFGSFGSGLLIDTFVPTSSGNLSLAQEARYKRSRMKYYGNSYTPTTLVDSLDNLDYSDITGKTFYKPTIFIPINNIDATKGFVADVSNFLGQVFWTFIYAEQVVKDQNGVPVELSLQKLHYVYDSVTTLYSPNDFTHKYPLLPKQQILSLTNSQLVEGLNWRTDNPLPNRLAPSNVAASDIIAQNISIQDIVSFDGSTYNIEESAMQADATGSSLISQVSSVQNMLVTVLFEFNKALDLTENPVTAKGILFLNAYLNGSGYQFSSPDHFDVDDLLEQQVPLLENVAGTLQYPATIYNTDMSLPRQFWSVSYDAITPAGLPNYSSSTYPFTALPPLDQTFSNRYRTLCLIAFNEDPSAVGVMDTYSSVVSNNIHLSGSNVTGSVFLSKKADRDIASLGSNPTGGSLKSLLGLPTKYDFFLFSRDHYTTLKGAYFELIDNGYAMVVLDDGTGNKGAYYYTDSDGNYYESYTYALHGPTGVMEVNTFNVKVTLATPANTTSTPPTAETPNSVNPQDIVTQINALSTLVYAAFGASSSGQPPAFIPIQVSSSSPIGAAPISGAPGNSGNAGYQIGAISPNTHTPFNISQIFAGTSTPYPIRGATTIAPTVKAPGVTYYGSLSHGLDGSGAGLGSVASEFSYQFTPSGQTSTYFINTLTNQVSKVGGTSAIPITAGSVFFDTSNVGSPFAVSIVPNIAKNTVTFTGNGQTFTIQGIPTVDSTVTAPITFSLGTSTYFYNVQSGNVALTDSPFPPTLQMFNIYGSYYFTDTQTSMTYILGKNSAGLYTLNRNILQSYLPSVTPQNPVYNIQAPPQIFTQNGNFFTVEATVVSGNGNTYPINKTQFVINNVTYIINTSVTPNVVYGNGQTYTMYNNNTNFTIDGIQYTVTKTGINGQYDIKQANVVTINNYNYELDITNGQVIGNGTVYPITSNGDSYTITTANNSFTVTTNGYSNSVTLNNSVFVITNTSVIGNGASYPIFNLRRFVNTNMTNTDTTKTHVTYTLHNDGTVTSDDPASFVSSVGIDDNFTDTYPGNTVGTSAGIYKYFVDDAFAVDTTTYPTAYYKVLSQRAFVVDGVTYLINNNKVDAVYPVHINPCAGIFTLDGGDTYTIEANGITPVAINPLSPTMSPPGPTPAPIYPIQSNGTFTINNVQYSIGTPATVQYLATFNDAASNTYTVMTDNTTSNGLKVYQGVGSSSTTAVGPMAGTYKLADGNSYTLQLNNGQLTQTVGGITSAVAGFTAGSDTFSIQNINGEIVCVNVTDNIANEAQLTATYRLGSRVYTTDGQNTQSETAYAIACFNPPTPILPPALGGGPAVTYIIVQKSSSPLYNVYVRTVDVHTGAVTVTQQGTSTSTLTDTVSNSHAISTSTSGTIPQIKVTGLTQSPYFYNVETYKFLTDGSVVTVTESSTGNKVLPVPGGTGIYELMDGNQYVIYPISSQAMYVGYASGPNSGSPVASNGSTFTGYNQPNAANAQYTSQTYPIESTLLVITDQLTFGQLTLGGLNQVITLTDTTQIPPVVLPQLSATFDLAGDPTLDPYTVTIDGLSYTVRNKVGPVALDVGTLYVTDEYALEYDNVVSLTTLTNLSTNKLVSPGIQIPTPFQLTLLDTKNHTIVPTIDYTQIPAVTSYTIDAGAIVPTPTDNVLNYIFTDSIPNKYVVTSSGSNAVVGLIVDVDLTLALVDGNIYTVTQSPIAPYTYTVTYGATHTSVKVGSNNTFTDTFGNMYLIYVPDLANPTTFNVAQMFIISVYTLSGKNYTVIPTKQISALNGQPASYSVFSNSPASVAVTSGTTNVFAAGSSSYVITTTGSSVSLAQYSTYADTVTVTSSGSYILKDTFTYTVTVSGSTYTVTYVTPASVNPYTVNVNKAYGGSVFVDTYGNQYIINPNTVATEGFTVSDYLPVSVYTLIDGSIYTIAQSSQLTSLSGQPSYTMSIFNGNAPTAASPIIALPANNVFSASDRYDVTFGSSTIKLLDITNKSNPLSIANFTLSDGSNYVVSQTTSSAPISYTVDKYAPVTTAPLAPVLFGFTFGDTSSTTVSYTVTSQNSLTSGGFSIASFVLIDGNSYTVTQISATPTYTVNRSDGTVITPVTTTFTIGTTLYTIVNTSGVLSLTCTGPVPIPSNLFYLTSDSKQYSIASSIVGSTIQYSVQRISNVSVSSSIALIPYAFSDSTPTQYQISQPGGSGTQINLIPSVSGATQPSNYNIVLDDNNVYTISYDTVSGTFTVFRGIQQMILSPSNTLSVGKLTAIENITYVYALSLSTSGAPIITKTSTGIVNGASQPYTLLDGNSYSISQSGSGFTVNSGSVTVSAGTFKDTYGNTYYISSSNGLIIADKGWPSIPLDPISATYQLTDNNFYTISVGTNGAYTIVNQFGALVSDVLIGKFAVGFAQDSSEKYYYVQVNPPMGSNVPSNATNQNDMNGLYVTTNLFASAFTLTNPGDLYQLTDTVSNINPTLIIQNTDTTFTVITLPTFLPTTSPLFPSVSKVGASTALSSTYPYQLTASIPVQFTIKDNIPSVVGATFINYQINNGYLTIASGSISSVKTLSNMFLTNNNYFQVNGIDYLITNVSNDGTTLNNGGTSYVVGNNVVYPFISTTTFSLDDSAVYTYVPASSTNAPYLKVSFNIQNSADIIEINDTIFTISYTGTTTGSAIGNGKKYSIKAGSFSIGSTKYTFDNAQNIYESASINALYTINNNSSFFMNNILYNVIPVNTNNVSGTTKNVNPTGGNGGVIDANGNVYNFIQNPQMFTIGGTNFVIDTNQIPHQIVGNNSSVDIVYSTVPGPSIPYFSPPTTYFSMGGLTYTYDENVTTTPRQLISLYCSSKVYPIIFSNGQYSFKLDGSVQYTFGNLGSGNINFIPSTTSVWQINQPGKSALNVVPVTKNGQTVFYVVISGILYTFDTTFTKLVKTYNVFSASGVTLSVGSGQSASQSNLTQILSIFSMGGTVYMIDDATNNVLRPYDLTSGTSIPFELPSTASPPAQTNTPIFYNTLYQVTGNGLNMAITQQTPVTTTSTSPSNLTGPYSATSTPSAGMPRPIFKFLNTTSNLNMPYEIVAVNNGGESVTGYVHIEPLAQPTFDQTFPFAGVVTSYPLTFETGGYNTYSTFLSETSLPLETYSGAYYQTISSTDSNLNNMISQQGDFSVQFWHSTPPSIISDYHPFVYHGQTSLINYIDIDFDQMNNIYVALNDTVMQIGTNYPALVDKWRHFALTYQQPYMISFNADPRARKGSSFEVTNGSNYNFNKDFSLAVTFSVDDPVGGDTAVKQGLIYKGTGDASTPPQVLSSYSLYIQNGEIGLDITDGSGYVQTQITNGFNLQPGVFYQLVLSKKTNTSGSSGTSPNVDPYAPPFNPTDVGSAMGQGTNFQTSQSGSNVNLSGIQMANSSVMTDMNNFATNLANGTDNGYVVTFILSTVGSDGTLTPSPANPQQIPNAQYVDDRSLTLTQTGPAHVLFGMTYDQYNNASPLAGSIRNVYMFNTAINPQGIKTLNGVQNIADIGTQDLIKAGLIGFWSAQYNTQNVVNNTVNTDDYASSNNSAQAYIAPIPAGYEFLGTSVYINGTQMKTTLITSQSQYPVGFTTNNGGLNNNNGASSLTLNTDQNVRLQEISVWQDTRQNYQIIDDMFGRLVTTNEPTLLIYLSGSITAQNINAPLLPMSKYVYLKNVQNSVATFPISFSGSAIDLAGCPSVGRCGPIISPSLFVPPGASLMVCDSIPYLSTYSVTTTDSKGGVFSGEVNEVYCYINNNVLTLFAGKKVGDLTLTWVSQMQGDVQLIGYIEGPPPCPMANLTNKTSYAGATSISMSAPTSVTYKYSSSSDSQNDTKIDFSYAEGISVGIKAEIAPIGFGASLDMIKLDLTFGISSSWQSTDNNTSQDTSTLKFDESNKFTVKLQGTLAPITNDNYMSYINTLTNTQNTVGTTATKTPIITDPNSGGFTSNTGFGALPKTLPTEEKFGARMYVPSPYGTAFVTSQTLDVYQETLVQSKTVYGFIEIPSPNIPPDNNILSFRINSKYIKPGVLDGVTNYAYNPATLANGSQTYTTSTGQMNVLIDKNFDAGEVGHTASYMKVVEAYQLKKQIDLEAFNAFALFNTAYQNSDNAGFNTDLTGALDFYDEYIWHARGGTTEIKHTFSTTFDQVYSVQHAKSQGGGITFNGKLSCAIVTPFDIKFAYTNTNKITQKYSYNTTATKSFDIVASFDGIDTDTQMRLNSNNDAHFIMLNNSQYNRSNTSGLNLVAGSDGLVYNIVPNVRGGAGLPQSNDADDAFTYTQPQPTYSTGNATGNTGNLVPYDRPGKTKLFRSYAYFLQPDYDNYVTFWNTVCDPVWLQNSTDTDAVALRSAQTTTSYPWRILYRVTYSERFLPPISGYIPPVPIIKPIVAVPVTNQASDFIYAPKSSLGSNPSNMYNDIEANIVLIAPSQYGGQLSSSNKLNNNLTFDTAKNISTIVNWGDTKNSKLIQQLLMSALGSNVLSAIFSTNTNNIVTPVQVFDTTGQLIYTTGPDVNGNTLNILANPNYTVYVDPNGNPIQYFNGSIYVSIQQNYVASTDGTIMFYVQEPTGYDATQYDSTMADPMGNYFPYGWTYYLVSGFSSNMTNNPTVTGEGPFLNNPGTNGFTGFNIATNHTTTNGYVLAQITMQYPNMNSTSATFADLEVYRAMSLFDTFPLGDPTVMEAVMKNVYGGASFYDTNSATGNDPDIQLVFAKNITTYFNNQQQTLLPQ